MFFTLGDEDLVTVLDLSMEQEIGRVVVSIHEGGITIAVPVLSL